MGAPSVKIVYLYQYFTTRSMPGGTRAYEQARRLVAQGHEVDVITTDQDADSASTTWRVTVEDGVRVHWLSVPYTNRMTFARRIRAFAWFALLASVRATRIRADVVFASSTPLTIAIPALVAARVRGPRFVFEVRDLWPEIPIEMGVLRSRVAIALARALAWVTYRRADRIVALSDGMADGVVAYGVPRDKVVVVPNAADVDLFAVGPEVGQRFRRENAWLGDRPLVVYVGTFGRVNGLGYLVDVAEKVREIDPEVRFLLVGDGAEYDDVVRSAERRGLLGTTVVVRHSVPKSEIPAILSAATLATSTTVPLPGLAANSANKFFDALAAGRPQAVNYGGWQGEELTRTGAGIDLDPHDVPAAAAALAAAVRDEPWLASAGAAARELADRRYDRDLLVERLSAAITGVPAASAAHQRPAGDAPSTAAVSSGGNDR